MIDLKLISEEIREKMFRIYLKHFNHEDNISIGMSSRKKDDCITVHSHLGSMVFDIDGNEVM